MVAAATTIQANFRGFQTRQTLKEKVEDTTSQEVDNERKTPTALTPELIESVKEEVDEICKEAESIAAERAESAEGIIKGVDHVLVETKASALPSVSDSIMAVRGSVSPPSVSEAEDVKEEVFEPLVDEDEKTINAATTIQATFRGFQARKNLNKDAEDQLDSMPDYPPPASEEEFLQSLEDLPPPDFEALESSYSEDVPTEPLAPPPPLQDSLVFNEEDEDALMSLQRPAECDELPEHRPQATTDTESEESSASLSSAATKIQAGVRGYLTRKQIQVTSGTGTGTTSTSTNVLDSDQSQSQSRDGEDDGVRSAISTEEESEICRHQASPEVDTPGAAVRSIRSAGKRMSLGSNVADLPPARQRAPLRSAMSVQLEGAGPVVSDEEVWGTLKGEMAEAATKIQSNFRGYRARKQLQREDAVQVTSSSSQATPTPSSGSVDATGRDSADESREPGADGAEGSKDPQASSHTTPIPPLGSVDATGRESGEESKGSRTDSVEGSKGPQSSRGSGEFHDIIVLSPPTACVVGGEGRGGGESEAHAQTTTPGPEPAGDAVEGPDMVKRRADDNGDPQESAATKIQATFRGYKARQGMRDVDRAAAKIQAGFRGYKVRKDMKKNGASPSVGQGERKAADEETAATKIQAGVRGFLVRRKYQKDHPTRGSGSATAAGDASGQ